MMLAMGSATVLRPMTADDVEPWWRWRDGDPDPEWKRWDAPYFPHERVTLDQALRRPLPDPWSLHVVEVNGHFAGTVTRWWEHEPSGWAEIGIVLFDPATWSGGVGTIALGRWLHMTAADPRVHRVGLRTWSGNERMVRLARRLGLAEEARFHEARIVRGQRYDSVAYGALASDLAGADTAS